MQRSRDLRRRGAVPGAARDVRRRARLGALLPLGVRARGSGTPLSPAGSAQGLVPGRLQGHRIAPPREGLQGLGQRRDRDRHAVRGRARLRRADWTRRHSSAARRSRQQRTRRGAWPASSWTTPRSVVLGSEPVRVDGEPVGRVTSGGYGYTVGRSIAYAYLPADQLEPGRRVEVGIFGRFVGAEVAREPLFDPENLRVRS